MEIRDNDSFYIIAPLSTKIDSHETERIVSEIMCEERNIGLDLRFVFDCTIDFVENLKMICDSKKISIFNINSDVFAIFNYMDLDKFANLFVSELDFEENKRQLINRSFSVVK